MTHAVQTCVVHESTVQSILNDRRGGQHGIGDGPRAILAGQEPLKCDTEQRLEGAKGTGQVDIWKRVFQAEETVSRKVLEPEHGKMSKASVAYAKWTRERMR